MNQSHLSRSYEGEPLGRVVVEFLNGNAAPRAAVRLGRIIELMKSERRTAVPELQRLTRNKRFRWQWFYDHHQRQVSWLYAIPGARGLEESLAIGALYALVRQPGRLLYKLRRCQYCGKKWLFAISDANVFCFTKCQKDNYRSSPQGKAKHAAYMRDEWRPRQKAGEGRRRRRA